MDRFLECAFFVAGLVFGSFLNVCISRIPHDESVITPASHCRLCGAAIRWYDNVPLASWLALRGRCRDCGASISLRYPAVEFLTGILFTACFMVFGPTLLTLKFCVFCSLLVGLIFMDVETGLLPREFTYPGIALGLAFSWLVPTRSAATQFLLLLYDKHSQSVALLSFADSVIAAVLGAAFFYLAWALYYVVRKKHGLGFGDVALMAMSGAFLGLKLTLLVIFCAPLLAVLYAMVLLAWETLGRRVAGELDPPETSADKEPFLSREIPFGAFLGACSLAAIFFGNAIWDWYLGMF